MLVKNPVAFEEKNKVYNTKYFVNVKLSGSGNPGSDTCDYTGTFFSHRHHFTCLSTNGKTLPVYY